MAQTKRPAVLLLVFGTLLAVVSTTEGSNSTKPQGSGIALNSFVLNQIAQNILTDPNALDNYLQQFLPTIMKSLPQSAPNSTISPMSGLLQKLLMDMAGLYTNQIQPTDDIGLAEAQLVEMLRESMKNPVVRGIVVQMAQTLVTEVMKQSNGTLPPTSAWPSVLKSIGTLPLAQRVLSGGIIRQLVPNMPPGQVDDACYTDSMDTVDSLVAMKKWALDMFDATGKVESGVQKGHFYFIGSYDQCYDAKPEVEKHYDVAGGITRVRTFGTRFCRADIKISDELIKSLNVDTRGVKLKLTWGLCVPDSCKSKDVKGFFNIGPLFNRSLPIASVYCYEEEDLSSDSSAIAAICVLSVFACFITFGTLIDACRAYSSTDDKPVSPTLIATPESSEKYNLSTVTNQPPPDLHANLYQPLTEKHDKSGSDYAIVNPAFTDSSLTNGNVNPEKAEVEIVMPSGFVAHRETGVEIVKSDKVVKNGGLQQISTDQSGKRTIQKQDSILIRLLLCFSIYTNIPKILQAKSSSGSVACIHGIRFFSLTWVVLGHTYNYGIISMEETFNAANLLDFVGILQRFTYQAVVAGGFAVDTFFVLSAFLLTWLQLKDTAKKRKKCTLSDSIFYYFHRFWRLTPMYMFVLMAFTCLYKYLGSGPMWPSSITTAEACRTSWWTNLLYVNNLVDLDDQCMGWTWYLANDMQFYVVSPIFLIAMYLSPVVGAIFTCTLLSLGMGIAFWKEHTYNGNFFTMKEDGGDYWRKVYIVPWCRVGCWAVGMLLGLLVYRRGKKMLRNKKIIGFGWLLATAVALFLVYIPYTEQKEGGQEWTRVERAFYEGFGRPAWGVCVAWVIFACYYGKGGIVNTILSWNGFIPLSRLTYAAYLVHPICMMVNVWSRRTLLYINDYSIIYLFLGHLCMTYMVAFVCSLAFEAPFMALEKVLFRRGRRS